MGDSVLDDDMGVSEADATQEVAAIYADIRAATAMPFVNLIWRKLAGSPAALRWTWMTMKPLYTNGAVFDEAARLQHESILPPVTPWPTAALRAVGVDEGSEVSIRAALAGYERGNHLNLVAFSAVHAHLEGAPGSSVSEQTAADARIDSLARNLRTSAPPAPRRRSSGEMDETTRALVRAANRIGARGVGCQVQVSLPRNLAHWPGFLSLYVAALRPLHDDGRLFTAIDTTLENGRSRGRRLVDMVGGSGPPPDALVASIRAPLERLVPHPMGRMIPVVGLLGRMMPNAR